MGKIFDYPYLAITMRKAPLIALIVLLFAASITVVRAEQAGVERIELQIEQEKVVRGSLAGPENSGETKIYEFEVPGGVRVETTITMSHVEYLSARIILGIGLSTGGYFLSQDDIVTPGSSKTYLFSWYTTSNETFRITLTSIADRYAPSVLNYTVKIILRPERDAPIVTVNSDGKQSTYMTSLVDAPPTVAEAAAAGPIATLAPGEGLSLEGRLSPSYAEKGQIVKLYGGKDIDDVYAVRVKPEAGSSLRVKLTPNHGSAVLSLSLMTADGFTLDASTSREGFVPATAQVNFTRQGDQEIYVKVSLLRANSPELGYTLEVELTRAPQKPTITEQEPPLFPESQARTIVIGASAVIIILTFASIIVGRFRRRSMTAYGYEW
ncbi:MAG: hypothetical protein QXI52_07155 [Nitrososphaerota archaeon]